MTISGAISGAAHFIRTGEHSAAGPVTADARAEYARRNAESQRAHVDARCDELLLRADELHLAATLGHVARAEADAASHEWAGAVDAARAARLQREDPGWTPYVWGQP